MADIEVKSDSGGQGGKPKPKKKSTRIDLTPMVDLGFLLITFFIFTTTMSNPSAMSLVMPDDTAKESQKQQAAEEGAITILVDDPKSKAGRYFFYEGNVDLEGTKIKRLDDPNVQAEFKQKLQLNRKITIRDIIQYKKKDALAHRVDMVCILKPTKEASYSNVIDILDEMTINEIKLYTLSKMNGVERKSIDKLKQFI